MKKTIFYFAIFLFSTPLFAQDTTIYIVSGKIFDVATLQPIPLTYLLNTTKLNGVQTDTSGKFRILITENDSIRISCIGYYTEHWQPDFSTANGLNLIYSPIYLRPQTYPLGRVDIYKTRWDAFVYDIANTEIYEDDAKRRMAKWINTIVENEDLENVNVESGIRMPLPIHTHREKQIEKISKQKKIDELNQKAEQKFNKRLVYDITKLQGAELDKFMKHCRFDRDFILKTSDYELIVIIQEIFEEYKLTY